jgi:hypothetical protein
MECGICEACNTHEGMTNARKMLIGNFEGNRHFRDEDADAEEGS